MEHSIVEEVASAPGFSIVSAPNRINLRGKGKSIFLAGTIKKYDGVYWQTSVANKLSNLPVTILNPLRLDWDSTWVEDISFQLFREQVEWEQDMLEAADVIALYFAPGTESPISLLELGLCARSGKMVVACPPDYWKRGYVQMICRRLEVEFVETIDQLVQHVEQKLQKLLMDTPLETDIKRINSEKLNPFQREPFVTVSEMTRSEIS